MLSRTPLLRTPPFRTRLFVTCLHRATAGLLVGLGMLVFQVAYAATSGPAGAMGPDDARHLLTRSGFAPTPEQIADYAKLSRSEAVDRILAGTRSTPVTAWPDELDDFVPYRIVRTMSEQQRRDANRVNTVRGVELRAWWLGEMLVTPSPLTERMTLFWHNHFVSSQDKVRPAKLMLQQNLTLREHATGNFGKLLTAASKDPAMLIYLDGRNSRKAQPNENFAREVMELFTLGEGHYSERDIKEAARAFTGWDIDGENAKFFFRANQHDTGVKEIFGKRGNFNGDDVLRLLLERRETAEFISTKLWREFVSAQADKSGVQQVAGVLRDAGYEIKPALRTLFLSDAFWAQDNRGALVKSPVDLVVGSLRSLEADVPDPLPFVRTLRQMGQDLFAPPNVRGWPGGEWWINSSSLLDRKQFLDRLARADDPKRMAALRRVEGSMSAANEVPMSREDLRRRAAIAVREMDVDLAGWSAELKPLGLNADRVLLPVAAVDNVMAMADDNNARVRALLLDPAYQLK